MTVRTRVASGIEARRDVVLLAGALVAVEFLLLSAYLFSSGATVLAPRYLLYPWVWVNVGLLAVWHRWTRPSADGTRTRSGHRLLAGGVAVGYGLLLTWLDGTLAAGSATTTAVRVVWTLPPGWGPAVFYDGSLLRVTLLPFKLVGYAALSALVYGLVCDAQGERAIVGLVGLFSCVSCTLPVAAALVSGLVGGSVGLTAATAPWSYDLSTLSFVLAVTLLWWRPDPRRLGRAWR